jgi:hypothetical protein
MGLRYDQETAVSRSIQQVDTEETAVLNGLDIYGRSEQIQNELVNYNLYGTDNSTVSLTIPEDFVLTEISVSVSCSNATGGCSATINKNGDLFDKFSITGFQLQFKEMKFPNVVIRAGTTFDIIMTNDAGGVEHVTYLFIGFRI